ncbi:hypothetical protein AYL99_04227 [Fonsecaea erecta]|uniref:Xylanolytic transcriptional activator regulatory domain-containing protein n=1 Tax=Fonsecaea erecta TaxID=1367422 RepID=A0A178ZQB2_9EURO|nr:hypothetical protein AYL99_04227 [Fonsecaea erecta]OAP62024.1 hypothetical protein AYL99_04227 [Fonsecaea erecta]
MENGLLCASDMNPALLSGQAETRFFADVFDPTLGSWLTDGFSNAQGLEALQGNAGEMLDLSLLRAQDPTGALEMNYNFQFGFFPAPNANSTNPGNARPNRYSMPFPAMVVDDAIDSFFKYVAGWLPLFHKPRFYEKYNVHGQDPEKYQSLSLEDCLILDTICALAARFSASSYFAHLPPKGRAEPFLNQATQLFQDAMKLDSAIQPNLSLLQGLLLLGWYHQVCGSSGRCGNLIGVSCRLAYDLGLNNIDHDILDSKATAQWTSSEEWSRKEELRRAWWLAWELDMFSGTILKRPHTIDKSHINVLLPVSDEAWFSDTPVASVAIIPDPLHVWKTLKDSPNDNDRAWFLVASFLRAFAHDIFHRRHTTVQTVLDFQSSLTCFSLILPQRFHLSANCLSYDETNFSGNNWIICTHLILHSSRSSLRLLCHRKFPEHLDVSLETSALEDEKLVCRVIREWDPNFIPRTCPLVTTTLLGPAAMNAKTACELAANPDESRPIYLEMLKLVLGAIGSFWQIGASVLGPIVRITPDQLHVKDMEAYNEIFRSGSRFSKWPQMYSTESANGFFNVADSKAVKPWKDPFRPYFSKAAITRLEPLIHNRVQKFVSVLAAAASAGKAVDLSLGYRSLTSDVVMSYCFADQGFKSLEADEFQSPMLLALEQMFDVMQYTIYWHNAARMLLRLLSRMTKEQAEKYVPALAATNWISEQCRQKVEKIMSRQGSQSKYPTVFDAWADPSFKKDSFNPTLEQLTADAFVFHGAGTDTTAHTLTLGSWHIMNNKEIVSKLRKELERVIPDPDSTQMVSTTVLEELPYLHAVVKESLRMALGVPGRIPRVVPEGGVVLCGQMIPAGTPVSSTAYGYHYDPVFFPEPHTFRPERWLGANARELESQLISFSRGPRSCLGINLAHAELYLTFAYLVRTFDLMPYDMKPADMEWKDNFVVTTKGHLRVTVRKVAAM